MQISGIHPSINIKGRDKEAVLIQGINPKIKPTLIRRARGNVHNRGELYNSAGEDRVGLSGPNCVTHDLHQDREKGESKGGRR